MNNKQSGFTLVEIAIVLVIIGLLLGGILKGQELINSARVRNMADMNVGIQAAYFGFIDRYRRVPGDWNPEAAETAIGVPITGGGDDNGRIDNTGAPPASFTEPNALWEHLAKAGFIQGAYDGTANTEPTTTNNLTPLNAFNNIVILGRTADYQGTAAVRLNLILGRGIPVDIARELDVKLDDGLPLTGALRLTAVTSGTFGSIGETDAACLNVAGTDYDIFADVQDCNTLYLY
jgi:prepilin-type N-terminal cleavage/methylation domain-containing protein